MHDTTTSPTSDGAPAAESLPVPAAPSGPRFARREAWLDLPPDTYPGFKVKVWVNYPRGLQDEITGDDEARTKAALQQIVLEHNDWRGFQGEPLPAANTAAFWDAIPDELAGAILVLLRLEAGKLSTSLVPTRSRR